MFLQEADAVVFENMSSSKKITLKSSDGEAFEVDEVVALESQTIKHMIEDDCADNGIPLPNVTSKILAKVIEYCKKHVEATNPEERTSDDDLKTWDAEFVRVDQATLFDLILVGLIFVQDFGSCWGMSPLTLFSWTGFWKFGFGFELILLG